MYAHNVCTLCFRIGRAHTRKVNQLNRGIPLCIYWHTHTHEFAQRAIVAYLRSEFLQPYPYICSYTHRSLHSARLWPICAASSCSLTRQCTTLLLCRQKNWHSRGGCSQLHGSDFSKRWSLFISFLVPACLYLTRSQTVTYICVCVCVCACVRACMRACAYVCMHNCLCVCTLTCKHTRVDAFFPITTEGSAYRCLLYSLWISVCKPASTVYSQTHVKL